MRVHNLYTDPNGQSHFRDIEVEWVEERRGSKLSSPHGAAWSSFTSWVINSGRNLEAKPSTKSLFAYTAAQCARRSSSSNFPETDKLINCAGVGREVGLEIPDDLLILPALLKRRKAKFLVALHGPCHRPDAKRICSQFIERP